MSELSIEYKLPEPQVVPLALLDMAVSQGNYYYHLESNAIVYSDSDGLLLIVDGVISNHDNAEGIARELDISYHDSELLGVNVKMVIAPV